MSLNQNFINIGQELKEKREDQGISLEQIADWTKIGVPILQDIEAAQITTNKLPYVYLRGFILAYAKVIGLDVKVIDKELKTCFADESNISGVQSSDVNTEQFIEKELHLTPIILATVILIILGVILLFTNTKGINKVNLINSEELQNKNMIISQEAAPVVLKPAPIVEEFNLEIIIKALSTVIVFYQIDKSTLKEISLKKDQFHVLKGKHNILIKTDNSHLISIFQNGKNLGIFGSGGKKSSVFVNKKKL